MNKDISQCFVEIARELNAKFYLLDRMISFEDVFSVTGLVPGLARRADQLCSLCLGYGLGISFKDAEQGVLGAEVIFDEATPLSIRLVFITDTICEMINSSPSSDYTPLDELLKESVFD